jgi:hypothetical protein
MEALRELSSDENIERDRQHFLPILENWKKKNQDPRNPNRKPKMYFINVSGGGLRAAMYSMLMLQKCDSIAGGNLLDKTVMISGASGGMFATTYLRELFLQKKNGRAIDLNSPEFTENVSKDVLNPIALSIVSNDILIPFHKFPLHDKKYSVDRGYVFEKFYCSNTGFPWEKKISDYREDELERQNSADDLSHGGYERFAQVLHQPAARIFSYAAARQKRFGQQVGNRCH